MIGLGDNSQEGAQQRELHLQQRCGQRAGLRQRLKAPVLVLHPCNFDIYAVCHISIEAAKELIW